MTGKVLKSVQFSPCSLLMGNFQILPCSVHKISCSKILAGGCVTLNLKSRSCKKFHITDLSGVCSTFSWSVVKKLNGSAPNKSIFSATLALVRSQKSYFYYRSNFFISPQLLSTNLALDNGIFGRVTVLLDFLYTRTW